MKVVDSSGWLEYFSKGPNGERFAPAIQDSQSLLVPVICLYEVYKRVALQRGEDDALQAAAWMMTGTVIEISPEIAFAAAELSIEHRLPMADSLILACARLHRAELWTQDEHFKGLDQVVYIEKG
jgi:toxin FitB